jgi:hypothetical protein
MMVADPTDFKPVVLAIEPFPAMVAFIHKMSSVSIRLFLLIYNGETSTNSSEPQLHVI